MTNVLSPPTPFLIPSDSLKRAPSVYIAPLIACASSLHHSLLALPSARSGFCVLRQQLVSEVGDSLEVGLEGIGDFGQQPVQIADGGTRLKSRSRSRLSFSIVFSLRACTFSRIAAY